MRNVDDNRAAEGPPDDGTGAAYTSAMTRRNRRRKQAMIGAVGLLSLLGAGGLTATQLLDDGATASSNRAGAVEPIAPAGPSSSASGGSPSASGTPTASATASPSPAAQAGTPTPQPKTTAERIAAVRSLAAKPNNQVRRPPAPNGAAAAMAVNAAEVSTTEVEQDGERLTINSARQDLSGYNHLGLVADPGTKHGDARCTKKIRVRTGEQPRERPTLLICWRTSATKSVYTVAVKLDGRPSPTLSVAALNKEWAKLG